MGDAGRGFGFWLAFTVIVLGLTIAVGRTAQARADQACRDRGGEVIQDLCLKPGSVLH